mmetsp:Transcript_26102/g.42650  ORF Transcript_26102/g.42650 Transcript_26102/m.42650 type:complete len:293 (+) Transcript_26102:34-912(+)
MASSSLLVKGYCVWLAHRTAFQTVIDELSNVELCVLGYIGKHFLMPCSDCGQCLRFDAFSKSQASRKSGKTSPRCKACIVRSTRHKQKKKIPKTAQKPVEIDIVECRQSVIDSFHGELRQTYFGVIAANIILSYSHILVEGIYRFGHRNDAEWRRNKDQSQSDYAMHQLILKPNMTFRWKYAQYICNGCHVAEWDKFGVYEVLCKQDRIGGQTELKLSDVKDDLGGCFRHRGSRQDALFAVIDCDRDLVMSFTNKMDAESDQDRVIFQFVLGRTRCIRLEKVEHSVWVIPKY